MVQWLKKNTIAVFCVIAALAAGLALGYGAGGLQNRQQTQEQEPQAEAEPVSGGTEKSVLPDTEVCWTYLFTACGHSIRLREKDGDLTGYTRTDIEAAYPNITVRAMAGDRADLLCEVDAYCPEHYLLYLNQQEQLEVRRTDAETFQQEVVMTLSADPALLPQETQTALREGMVFDSLEQINGYLEDAES